LADGRAGSRGDKFQPHFLSFLFFRRLGDQMEMMAKYGRIQFALLLSAVCSCLIAHTIITLLFYPPTTTLFLNHHLNSLQFSPSAFLPDSGR
jgi:hypothetical protein